jgi:Mn-dependent DtxR family transcriptional regulator
MVIQTNPTIGTVKKIKEYLENRECATPTEISQNINIKPSSVFAGIQFLKEFDQVEFITNGKTMLIRNKLGKIKNEPKKSKV